MKQTITILSALIAIVLLATGFIVASNLELTRKLENCENQLLLARSDLADAQSQIKRHTQERTELSRQLEQSEAATRQIGRALESLAAEYRILSKAHAAPEKERQQPAASEASTTVPSATKPSRPVLPNTRHRKQTFFICWQ